MITNLSPSVLPATFDTVSTARHLNDLCGIGLHDTCHGETVAYGPCWCICHYAHAFAKEAAK